MTQDELWLKKYQEIMLFVHFIDKNIHQTHGNQKIICKFDLLYFRFC